MDVEDLRLFLAALVDPNVAYLITLGGAWLAVMALLVPGSGLLEIGAAVGLVFGAASLWALAASLPGLVLLAASFVVYALADVRFFAAHKRGSTNAMQERRLLSLLATFLQVMGGLMLFINEPGVSLWVIGVMALASLAAHLWIIQPVLNSLRPPPQSGAEALIGAVAVVRRAPAAPGKPGMVFFNGELWQAIAEQSLAEGDEVQVVGRKDMTLLVQKAVYEDATPTAALDG